MQVIAMKNRTLNMHHACCARDLVSLLVHASWKEKQIYFFLHIQRGNPSKIDFLEFEERNPIWLDFSPCMHAMRIKKNDFSRFYLDFPLREWNSIFIISHLQFGPPVWRTFAEHWWHHMNILPMPYEALRLHGHGELLHLRIRAVDFELQPDRWKT